MWVSFCSPYSSVPLVQVYICFPIAHCLINVTLQCFLKLGSVILQLFFLFQNCFDYACLDQQIFFFCIKKLFFNYNLHSIFFVLFLGVQPNGQTIIYFTKWSPQYFQYLPDTTYSYYNVIDCILYLVVYLPVTVL